LVFKRNACIWILRTFILKLYHEVCNMPIGCQKYNGLTTISKGFENVTEVYKLHFLNIHCFIVPTNWFTF
jgi:hypothetical protein